MVQAELKKRINDEAGALNQARQAISDRLASGELKMDSPEFAGELEKVEKAAEALEALRANIDRFDKLEMQTDKLTHWDNEVPNHVQAVTHQQSRYHQLTVTPQYTDSFNRYLRRYAQPAEYLPTHTDVLREGVDPAGGVLVPADRVTDILTRMKATSVMLGAAKVRPTSRDRIEQIRLIPDATYPHIYSSGFVGSWVPETPAASAGEVEPSWGMLVVPIRKARTKTYISNDLLADAEFDVLADLAEDGGGNLGLVLDKGFITGIGIGEPVGVAFSPDIATVDVEGSTANTISNTIAAIGSAAKLINLQYDLPSQYWPDSKWLMHRSTEAEIRKLVDASGRFLWSAGFAEKPDELLGYPVMRSDWMPEDGTDAAKVIVWGNFREGYLIGQRQLLSVQVDPFSSADIEQTRLYLRVRAGGDVRNPDALRVGIV